MLKVMRILSAGMLLLAVPAHAEVSVSYIYDSFHAKDAGGVQVRYMGDKWGAHFAAFTEREIHAIGIDRIWRKGNLSGGIGVAYLDETNRINGTKPNFALRVDYHITPYVQVGWLHYSNGNFLFHWNEKPNKGWNFISVGVTF